MTRSQNGKRPQSGLNRRDHEWVGGFSILFVAAINLLVCSFRRALSFSLLFPAGCLFQRSGALQHAQRFFPAVLSAQSRFAGLYLAEFAGVRAVP
jgi:hypothetical protein